MKDILKYIEINAFIVFFLTFLILLFLINCTFVIFVVTLNQYCHTIPRAAEQHLYLGIAGHKTKFF